MKQRIATLLMLLLVALAGGQGSVGVDAYGDALPPGAMTRLGTQRYRHDGPIVCQAVSNDGRLVATGGGRTVRVWDAASGRQMFVLAINQNNRAVAPSAVAFSPDGQMLAALGAYGQGVVTVWDLKGGQSRQEMTLPPREEYTNTMMEMPFLAFAGNNKHLLVKNYTEKSVRHYDLDTGMEMRSYQDGSTSLTTMAASPDGKTLAAGTESRQIILWDTVSGKELRRLQQEYPLVSLSFSPGGQLLAAMDQDLAPRIWNLATGTIQYQMSARTRCVGMTWSLNGESLYVSRQPDQVLRWNVKTGQEKLFAVPRGWVAGPVYSCQLRQQQEGMLLGSSGRRGNNVSRLRRIDLERLEQASQFDGYESSNVYAVYLPHRQQWATIGTQGDTVLRFWDEQGKVVQTFDLPLGEVNLRCFAINGTGQRMAISAMDGRTFLIDTDTGKILKTLTPFARACYDVEFSEDGELIILTDLRHVKVIEASSGKELTSYDLHTADPLRTVISGDGNRIASMVYIQEEEQVNLKILEARTGKVLSSDVKMPLQNQSFYLSPDGRNLVIMRNMSRGGNLTVVEAASGKTRFTGTLPPQYAFLGSHARLSPDGRWLSTSASGTDPEQFAAIVWHLGGKGEPITLTGHRGSISSSHFSYDGNQLLTVSADSTMLVWDLRKHRGQAATAVNEAEYAKLWQELAETDTVKAYQAVHRMAQQPQAAAWLGKQIAEKTVILKPDQIQTWIQQLNASQFAVREEATNNLIKHAVQAKSVIRSAIEKAESIETRRRLEQILNKVRESTGLSDNPLQTSRGIEALELMGTPSALEALQQLASRRDAVGQEAKESAQRLGFRVKK